MTNSKVRYSLRNTVLTVLFGILLIGGCDVDFGGGGNGGSSGGGNSTSNIETVQGTIVSTIPEIGIDSITVQVEDTDTQTVFSDVTNASGFFSITGTFAGSPEMEFLNEDLTSLARIFINVFPGARVEFGDIRLENGTAIFDDNTDVTFEGDVVSNDCTTNSGTLEVLAKNSSDEIEVLVQITAATDIIREDETVDCEDLLIGQNIEVRGILLLGNSVDAFRIDIQ